MFKLIFISKDVYYLFDDKHLLAKFNKKSLNQIIKYILKTKINMNINDIIIQYKNENNFYNSIGIEI